MTDKEFKEVKTIQARIDAVRDAIRRDRLKGVPTPSELDIYISSKSPNNPATKSQTNPKNNPPTKFETTIPNTIQDKDLYD